MDDFKFQQVEPREFLDEVFPREVRSYLNNCTKLGYELANNTIENDAQWLSELRGKSVLPRIKTLGVEYMIVKYINSGLINLNYSIEYTSHKKNTYLLFSDPDKKITLIANQTSSEERPSRFAQYRADRFKPFESYFDFDNNKLITDRPIYTELNHGHQTTQPSFSVLGIPRNSREWYGYIALHKEEMVIINSKSNNFTPVQSKLSDFDFTDFEDFIREKEK